MQSFLMYLDITSYLIRIEPSINILVTMATQHIMFPMTEHQTELYFLV